MGYIVQGVLRLQHTGGYSVHAETVCGSENIAKCWVMRHTVTSVFMGEGWIPTLKREICKSYFGAKLLKVLPKKSLWKRKNQTQWPSIRPGIGCFNQMFAQLWPENKIDFENCTRMSISVFYEDRSVSFRPPQERWFFVGHSWEAFSIHPSSMEAQNLLVPPHGSTPKTQKLPAPKTSCFQHHALPHSVLKSLVCQGLYGPNTLRVVAHSVLVPGIENTSVSHSLWGVWEGGREASLHGVELHVSVTVLLPLKTDVCSLLPRNGPQKLVFWKCWVDKK